MDQIVGSFRRYIVLAPPPETVDLGECKTPVSGPRDCEAPIPDLWTETADAESTAAAAAGWNYVDTRDWFCVNGTCPSFVGTIPMKRDAVHLSKEYAELLAPIFGAALTKIGIEF
jgi:hypothetical protein